MKIYLENCNGVLDEVQKHFKLVSLRRAERVVLWNDCMPPQIQIIKQTTAPVIVVQHGRVDDSSANNIYDRHPFLADRICAWGEKDVELFARLGIPRGKIYLTGTTIFSGLYKKPHRDFTVAFVPRHDDEFALKNRQAAEDLKKLPIRVITKITDSQPAEQFINPVVSNRYAANHLSRCAGVLAESDVVLSNSPSTFELMAHYLKIPVVRSVAEIATAKYNAREAERVLREQGQSEGALEKMIKVIKAASKA